MNISNIWWLAPAALLMGSCKKSEPSGTAGTSAAIEAPADTPAAPETTQEQATQAGLSAEERAATLGFARHLPKETGVLISLHNAGRHAKRIQSSKLWRLIAGEIGIDPDELSVENDAEIGADSLIAREFTLAVGPQVGAQTANLLKLNQRLSFFQMSAVVSALDGFVKAGDSSEIENAISESLTSGLLIGLLNDPESGIGLFEEMNMPAIYAAFGTTPDNRDAVAQQIASPIQMMGMMDEWVEQVEVEKNGQIISGYKISGAKLAELMKQESDSMQELLDTPTLDRLIAAVSRKDLVIMSGMIGDYALLFIGASTDDLVIADDLDSSLLAGNALAFCDDHIQEDIAAVVYGNKDSISSMASQIGGISHLADGLREGLAAASDLGDTRDLQALLRLVGDRESSLMKLWSIEATGTVAFIQDGLRIESYGGVDVGAYDWSADNRLNSLKDSEGIAVFANATANNAYTDLASNYIEAIMETLYAVAMKAAELPIEQTEMEQFREFADIFDTKFREDALALWNALSGEFSAGLGNETAWIIDLNGSPPPIPGLPQDVVDNGKFPRITAVSSVTERAKLTEAWRKIDSSATSILGTISEMQGSPVPMQKPLSSDRNGYTTWFFPLPFLNDDFLPSVTVGDEWFALSSSRNQALDLLNKAGAGQPEKGASLLVNFDALREFATLTAGLLEENAESLQIEPDVIETLGKLASAMEDFKQLTMHSRKDAGTLRSSIHLKTR